MVDGIAGIKIPHFCFGRAHVTSRFVNFEQKHNPGDKGAQFLALLVKTSQAYAIPRCPSIIYVFVHSGSRGWQIRTPPPPGILDIHLREQHFKIFAVIRG